MKFRNIRQNKNINDFISEYAKAISSSTAAVFAGAGLSCDSGFVNWKDLLRDIAQSIGLDIDKETDLISVAQYYKNENGGNRNKLNQDILDNFTKYSSPNKCMDILATLPIKTYWTTNYDHIIENTLEKHDKKVDVKILQNNLSINIPDNDAVVYKFHGDILFPSEAVLTKDDYEIFNITHNLFITSLQGDLISKTFIFIGYSFNDPNFLQVLSKIRILLGENSRMHYFFTKKITRSDFKNKNEYLYAHLKRKLFLKDLLRYGIQSVEIENYSDIPQIFECIKRLYLTNSIFISGSCRNYGNWNQTDAYELLYNTGYQLVKNGFKISTGLIEGVGPQLVNGALTAIGEMNLNIEKVLSIKTLPLIKGSDAHIKYSAKKKFQDNMISQAGIVIFFFGNQYYNNILDISKGVIHDYERAKAQQKYIIPIGSTGFAAEWILNNIEININDFTYLKPFMKRLKNERNPEKIVTLVLEIINYIRKNIEFF